LADVFFHFDAEYVRREAVLGLDVGFEPRRDVAGEQFRRGVFDRQEHAIAAREEPFAIFVFHMHARPGLGEVDDRVFRRQHHAMVEIFGDRFRQFLQGDEVEDVKRARIEVAFDLDGGAVVVAVQAFAAVAFEADEVSRAEDEMIFRDAHFVSFSHDEFRRCRSTRADPAAEV
jgi:hypothetical protein